MASVERMYALYTAVNHVLDNGIAGDFVECGEWRGGSAMLMPARVAQTCRLVVSPVPKSVPNR
jgi:O-methyltransferase